MDELDFELLSDQEIKKIRCKECDKKVKISAFGEITEQWYEEDDEYLCERCYNGTYGMDEEEEEGWQDYIEKINKD